METGLENTKTRGRKTSWKILHKLTKSELRSGTVRCRGADMGRLKRKPGDSLDGRTFEGVSKLRSLV